MIFKKIYILIIPGITILFGCSRPPSELKAVGDARLNPDYSGIVIPPNIAPLNFDILEPGDRYRVDFSDSSNRISSISSRNGKIRIHPRIWFKILNRCKGSDLLLDIYILRNHSWKRYSQIRNHIAEENIDRFLVYRLIDPGYETWNNMGLYQRDLSAYTVKTVIKNEMTGGNCMNCHSFCKNDPESMLFHTRGQPGGTIIVKNDSIFKVNTKTGQTISAGVYPAWHPGSRYIAFSVNHIVQSFHAMRGKRVEVTDTLSDLVLYDTENSKIITYQAITGTPSLETFPAWSPDGKFLFYCCANAASYKNENEIRYNLLRIGFKEAGATLDVRPDTLIFASKDGYSISFPRISPDGRYLMFCRTSGGNFTIWHDDSDLQLLDLRTGRIVNPDINSQRSESYHSWSSNGRWIVFSSRRVNGLYTNLFISYFDASGVCHKPFILPQKDPRENDMLLKSYNVPELISRPIKVSANQFARVIRSEGRQASAD